MTIRENLVFFLISHFSKHSSTLTIDLIEWSWELTFAEVCRVFGRARDVSQADDERESGLTELFSSSASFSWINVTLMCFSTPKYSTRILFTVRRCASLCSKTVLLFNISRADATVFPRLLSRFTSCQ